MNDTQQAIIVSLINKKWKDPYLLDLAIHDHIHEISILKNKLIECKNLNNEPDRYIIDDHLDCELADLYILLDMKYKQNSPRIDTRIQKFIDKL